MGYHVVADLLHAVEFGSVAVTAGDIHHRAGTRPATTAATFDAEFVAVRHRRRGLKPA
jgi:hypothetical protein